MRLGRWHPVSYQVASAAFVPEPLAEHGELAGIARLGRRLANHHWAPACAAAGQTLPLGQALRGRQALRPTSASQAKSLYPAALSAAVFDEVIAVAIRGDRLEFHRLAADHAGNERCERALVVIHSASNSLRNRSFLPSRSRCPRERNPRRDRRARLSPSPRERIGPSKVALHHEEILQWPMPKKLKCRMLKSRRRARELRRLVRSV
jgi:hypothetical protein